MIRLAESEEDIAACFPVMHELRSHLAHEEFLRRVELQRQEGYQLAMLIDQDGIRAVAGFRVINNLSTGRVLYVDDLVTAAAHRSRGHGAELLNWLIERARMLACDSVELDSGVQRFDAHRFYLQQRFQISSHHFRLALRHGS